MTAGQPTLPGLESRGTDGPMLKAAQATIAALNLTPAQSALGQLVLSLAMAIDSGARSGRASAVAMAAAQLRETMLVLDPPADDDASRDAARMLDDFLAAAERAANGDRAG